MEVQKLKFFEKIMKCSENTRVCHQELKVMTLDNLVITVLN